MTLKTIFWSLCTYVLLYKIKETGQVDRTNCLIKWKDSLRVNTWTSICVPRVTWWVILWKPPGPWFSAQGCQNRKELGADECGEKTQLGSLALVGVWAKLERVGAIELEAVRMVGKEEISQWERMIVVCTQCVWRSALPNSKRPHVKYSPSLGQTQTQHSMSYV